MKIHEKYMRRCLELAKNGLPPALPNPSVGAVIVCDDKIIGEGYTSAYGGAHAEVNAIASVKNTELLHRATLYVSLEPCSHFGKTPPCCDLIIHHRIPNIVVGTVDPNPQVAGTGISKIIAAGSSVMTGVLEKECIEMNRRFFIFHNKKRPYIILKWAETQDGFIAPEVKSRDQKKQPFWISNRFSRQLVHKWRSEEQAILAGTQTVIDDNPRLDVRDWKGRNPIRIVLDQKNRIPKENYIFDNTSKTIVLTAKEIDFDKKVGEQIADYLYQQAIQTVIIEGGRQTIQTFIEENLWDEARVFKGTGFLKKGIKAPDLNQDWMSKSSVLEDELLIFRNYD